MNLFTVIIENTGTGQNWERSLLEAIAGILSQIVSSTAHKSELTTKSNSLNNNRHNIDCYIPYSSQETNDSNYIITVQHPRS